MCCRLKGGGGDSVKCDSSLTSRMTYLYAELPKDPLGDTRVEVPEIQAIGHLLHELANCIRQSS